MKHSFLQILKCGLLGSSLAMSVLLSAQTIDPASTTQGADPEKSEKPFGDYVVTQSFELGYRFVDVTNRKAAPGAPTDLSMYNTLVNLHEGPRVLEQSISIQSPSHNGALFDELSVSSFGFGGDPNDVVRARASKYNLYDFTGLFRRDWNFFDYNLLVNPLNPANSNPSIPILNSPHSYDTVRRMLDLGLTIAPQRLFSVRLDYNRNTFEGRSSSTIPEASDDELIETQLVQKNRVITDGYRFGIDFRGVPRTIFSYDQFITHTKYGTTWSDQNLPFVLTNGTPADLGIVWNTLNGQPCGTPFIPAPPVASELCSLYLAYNRSNPVTTNAPTEQFRVSSNLIPRVSLNGSIAYSNLDMRSTFNDFFNGFLADTGTRQYTTTGPIRSERIAVSSDLAATVRLTKRLRLVNQFRFYAFRIPSSWNSFFSTWSGDSAFSPVGPTPDSVDNTFFTRLLKENTKSNETDVEYDLSKSVGVRLGYRFARSTYSHLGLNQDLTTGDEEIDEDIVEVNSYTAIGGVWFRPVAGLRANADIELTTADNFLTRISPRRRLQYRFRSSYQPRKWINLGVTANVLEARNGVSEISYNAHNRNFGFTVSLAPNERFGLDLAYNLNNVGSNSFICFQSSPSPATTNGFACAADEEGGAPIEIYQTYGATDNYGLATAMIKPSKQVRLNLGYSIVSVNGTATILNPLQPYGSLRSNFHRPVGEVEIGVSHGVSLIGRWNYYDYREKDPFFGPTLPRDFHANVTVVALRYVF